MTGKSPPRKKSNEDAVGWIFPTGYPSIPARINAPWVDETAIKLGLARIVLIGQLQKRGRLDWRTTLVKGAPSVAEVLPTWE